jgi:hypothetical protein
MGSQLRFNRTPLVHRVPTGWPTSDRSCGACLILAISQATTSAPQSASQIAAGTVCLLHQSGSSPVLPSPGRAGRLRVSVLRRSSVPEQCDCSSWADINPGVAQTLCTAAVFLRVTTPS